MKGRLASLVFGPPSGPYPVLVLTATDLRLLLETMVSITAVHLKSPREL